MIIYDDGSVVLHQGDCIEVMRTLPDNSVDSVVTDPPYGLEFMGREWDSFKVGRAAKYNAGGSLTETEFKNLGTLPQYVQRPAKRCGKCGKQAWSGSPCKCESPEWVLDNSPLFAFQAWCQEWATEALRILKPGGHLAAFGGTRTYHRLACAIEDAGFEIRDSLHWVYGSGFSADGLRRDAPATDAARRWQGWGTAMKPSHEPIVLARKPLTGTVAANVQQWGTGGLNIDGCRVAADEGRPLKVSRSDDSTGVFGDGIHGSRHGGVTTAGRWPPNVLLDPAAAAALDAQSGESVSVASAGRNGKDEGGTTWNLRREDDEVRGHSDSGGASRFFPIFDWPFHYHPKAPSHERPRAFIPTCDCEDAWPTTSPARDTDETATAASSSTSKSGNATTGAKSPKATRSTTSTATNSTTTPPTSSPSPRPTTSDCTQVASSETGNGSSPADSAGSSSPSRSNTGTSAKRGGRCTDGAAPATSARWSATSVCGVCGKPSRSEAHSTVKPLGLMQWLVRLVTPPGGTVLEPFAGSGTTAEACVVEGFKCVAIEREDDYISLIVQRLSKPLRVCDPPVFGAPVWLCTCGHRAWTETAHHQHTKENQQ